MTFAGVPVLITGATGFIGSHLAERLLSLGANVRVLVRTPDRAAALAKAGALVMYGDLTNLSTLRGCCADCEVVFHCAAWLGTPYTPAVSWAVNVTGTEALANDALASGVRRFVYLSSIAVYGPVRDGIVTEDTPPWKGVELYGDSKIGAERIIRAASARGLPAVITRPGMVYGPRSRGWTIRLVQWISQNRPTMVAGGHGLARPIFIDNLVDALLRCADQAVAGHTFLLVDLDLPWKDFLAYYARIVRKPARSIPYVTAWLMALADETRALLTRRPPRVRRTALGYAVSHAVFSTEKARKLLGWVPRVPIDDAMRTTERWLREHGYLRA